MAIVMLAHLQEAAPRGANEVIRQVNEKWLIADGRSGAKDGVPQAKGFSLADIHAGDTIRQDAADQIEQVLLAAGFQRSLQLRIPIEVILDGALGAAGDENEPGGTGRDRLFHRILYEWLVDDRQHFLRHRLGGRQKPCSAPCYGKYGGAHRHIHWHEPSALWSQRLRILSKSPANCRDVGDKRQRARHPRPAAPAPSPDVPGYLPGSWTCRLPLFCSRT